MLPNYVLPDPVIPLLVILLMDWAFQFDDETGFMAIKVGNVPSQGVLAPKFGPRHTTISQAAPERLLGAGRSAPQSSCYPHHIFGDFRFFQPATSTGTPRPPGEGPGVRAFCKPACRPPGGQPSGAGTFRRHGETAKLFLRPPLISSATAVPVPPHTSGLSVVPSTLPHRHPSPGGRGAGGEGA